METASAPRVACARPAPPLRQRGVSWANSQWPASSFQPPQMKTGARPRRRQHSDPIFAVQHRRLPAPRRGNSTARDAPRRPSVIGTVDLSKTDSSKRRACVPKSQEHGISRIHVRTVAVEELFSLWPTHAAIRFSPKRATTELRSPSSSETAPAALLRLPFAARGAQLCCRCRRVSDCKWEKRVQCHVTVAPKRLHLQLPSDVPSPPRHSAE